MTQAGSDLRADAARNRALLVDAARELFAEQGLGVSMRQIALRAGVSEPTMRRRFPCWEALVAEAFEDKITAYADLAEEALAATDPWAGFAGFVERIARLQLVDRGFTEVLTLTFPTSMRAEQQRRRAYAAITALISRAQEQDSLRPDFSPEDIVLVLMAHAGVVGASGDLAPELSARLLAYLLEAFAAPGQGPLPPAPSGAATYRALLRLHASENTTDHVSS